MPPIRDITKESNRNQPDQLLRTSIQPCPSSKRESSQLEPSQLEWCQCLSKEFLSLWLRSHSTRSLELLRRELREPKRDSSAAQPLWLLLGLSESLSPFIASWPHTLLFNGSSKWPRLDSKSLKMDKGLPPRKAQSLLSIKTKQMHL